MAWVVLRTNPGCERKVAAALADLPVTYPKPGAVVRVALPEERRCRHRHGKQHAYYVPLFAGYVFADLPIDGGPVWDCVRKTVGMMRGRPALVTADGSVAVLTQKQIDDYLTLAADLSHRRRRHRARFAVGQTVQMGDCPFDGHLAEVAQCDDRGRVRVLLELFRQPTFASVRPDMLSAA